MTGVAGPARTELVGTGFLVDDHDVGRGQLGGDRLGGGDDAPGEPAGQEAFGTQGRRGLGDDLSGMPDVRPARQQGHRPSVPAVQGVAEDDVGLDRCRASPHRRSTLTGQPRT